MKTRARWLLGTTLLLVGGVLAAGVAGGVAAWSAYRSVEPGVGTAILARELPVPSRLYARPLVLQPGDSPERSGLALQLEAAGYRSLTGEEPEVGEFSAGEARWAIGRQNRRP